jgi:hypothetical protein
VPSSGRNSKSPKTHWQPPLAVTTSSISTLVDQTDFDDGELEAVMRDNGSLPLYPPSATPASGIGLSTHTPA